MTFLVGLGQFLITLGRLLITSASYTHSQIGIAHTLLFNLVLLVLAAPALIVFGLRVPGIEKLLRGAGYWLQTSSGLVVALLGFALIQIGILSGMLSDPTLVAFG